MYILAASVKRKRGGSGVKIPQELPKVLVHTGLAEKWPSVYILAASVKRKRGGSGVKIPQELPKVLVHTWFSRKVAKFHTSMYHHFDYFVIVMKRQFFKYIYMYFYMLTIIWKF